MASIYELEEKIKRYKAENKSLRAMNSQLTMEKMAAEKNAMEKMHFELGCKDVYISSLEAQIRRLMSDSSALDPEPIVGNFTRERKEIRIMSKL